MQAYRTEATVAANGVVTLSGLPFTVGKQVEVIVLETGPQATSIKESSLDETAIHPFQDRPGAYLQDPFAPALPEEEWEALQ